MAGTNINLNDLANKVAEKQNEENKTNIAQIHELQSIIIDELANEKPSDVLALLESRK